MIKKILSPLQYANSMLYIFAFTKVPMILYTRPKIVSISEQELTVKIPLRRRTRNHLKSMYFGTLAVGADVGAGMLAFLKISERKLPVSIVFKDFQADFLKRPENDVYFACEEGPRIDNMIRETLKSKERVSQPVEVTAYTDPLTKEPVAKFRLTLSMKYKKRP
ncbi:MAG: PaaI family thioesterase [Cytophagales bacterium]|nr:PaaI family thioesterase [Cytophagales bacterium]